MDLPGSGADGRFGSYRVSWEQQGADHVRTIQGGDSFTFVVEFAERLRAEGILPYGNSEDPASPYHGDQLGLYSESALRPIRFYREDVEAHTSKRLSVQ